MHISWYPADCLHAPNALHNFLLAINNPNLYIKEASHEKIKNPKIDDTIIKIEDVNGNPLGSIEEGQIGSFHPTFRR